MEISTAVFILDELLISIINLGGDSNFNNGEGSINYWRDSVPALVQLLIFEKKFLKLGHLRRIAEKIYLHF